MDEMLKDAAATLEVDISDLEEILEIENSALDLDVGAEETVRQIQEYLEGKKKP